MRSVYALALLAIAVVPSSADIDYTVNQTIGAGSVTGDIVTDGTIGNLSAGNIVDWNLTVNDGVSSSDLTGPLSGSNSAFIDKAGPGDLTATANELLFNFSATSSTNYAFFGDIAYPFYFWSVCGTPAFCTGNAPEDVGEIPQPGGAITVTTSSVSGTQVIASVTTSVTPEPSYFALLGVGIIGLLGFRVFGKNKFGGAEGPDDLR